MNADEEIDFVRDLSRAALLKEVGPWRTRALQAGLLGLAALATAGALDATYLRRRSRERHRLLEKEMTIAVGRPILDER